MSVFWHIFWRNARRPAFPLFLSPAVQLLIAIDAYMKIDTLPGSLPEFSLCETHREASTSRIALIASKFADVK